MKKILAVLALIVTAGVLYWQLTKPDPKPPAPPQVAPPAPAPAPPPPPPVPQIQHPVAEAPRPRLPSLDDSDGMMRDDLGGLFGKKRLRQFFFLDRIIRRIVATVDSLGRESLAPDLSPMKPVPGDFIVDGAGDAMTVSPRNNARYDSYFKLAGLVSPAKVVAVYRSLYPLFQHAYRELGYPKSYFNDRLVEVIDLMLDTPAASGPLRLTQPNARYDFADPELQKLPAGQKLILRLGPENAARAKTLLRQYRKELAAK